MSDCICVLHTPIVKNNSLVNTKSSGSLAATTFGVNLHIFPYVNNFKPTYIQGCEYLFHISAWFSFSYSPALYS